MRAAALALALGAVSLASAPSFSHCYSIWHYGTPQHCNAGHGEAGHGSAAQSKVAQAKEWSVEITKLPPEKLSEDDRNKIDQAEHDAAVEAHHDELNTLLKLLQAQEGNPGAWK